MILYVFCLAWFPLNDHQLPKIGRSHCGDLPTGKNDLFQPCHILRILEMYSPWSWEWQLNLVVHHAINVGTSCPKNNFWKDVEGSQCCFCFLGLRGEAFKTPHERPGTTCASGQISTGAATRPFYTDAIGAGELAVYSETWTVIDLTNPITRILNTC